MKSGIMPHIADKPLYLQSGEPKGFLTDREGESMYCIENYNLMQPFFMSIVSSSDLWMYLSSQGGLTAGRQNYNNALFPYETDDKIHENGYNTGPKTIVRLKEGQQLKLWEPFSQCQNGLYRIQRNLYKNTCGNKVIFEEINHDLELSFSYCWMNSDELGWVRKSRLENLSDKGVEADITDGLLNVLPFGITRETQSMMSTLMDAYKVGEFLPDSEMALFYMSSIPVDRAEPSEALRSNTVWSYGLPKPKVLLSPRPLDAIRQGEIPEAGKKVLGQKTAYIVHATINLQGKKGMHWYMLADVAKDSTDVTALQQKLQDLKNPGAYIENSVQLNTRRLKKLVSLADGIQDTGDPMNDRRHFANVMFNIMRGGVFEQNEYVEINDFLAHIKSSSSRKYNKWKTHFEGTKPRVQFKELLKLAESGQDYDLLRLTLEYLPLSFSRRHGDPSRPWNFFDIRVKDSDGDPSLNYQGNWRDIFQNWEALAFSFPGFLPGMITRFLNASTADGYNPYRITRDGFDWEVPEPDNPWAYIGYWGDHQVIYLLRLMELQEKFFPGSLAQKFNKPMYVYARVPYRIKSYEEILKNPQDTIVFDWQLHEHLVERSREEGNDGKLIHLDNGDVLHVTFIEKILVSLLTKVSNFVPDAGIWLNTQRPEWNDANNALVGNGASMVTLYHLRRMLLFLMEITQKESRQEYHLSSEVYGFLIALAGVLESHKPLLNKGFSDEMRKKITDQLGYAGSTYRESVYGGFSGESGVLAGDKLLAFYQLVLDYLYQTIAHNQREDKLYHSYNLLEFGDEKITVQHLYLMLEGQAALLNSGLPDPEQTRALMEALFASELYREDQNSFMLYPFRDLPGFMEKNIIPEELLNQSYLLQDLLKAGRTDIVRKDISGDYHFGADLRNANMLDQELEKFPEQQYTRTEKNKVLEIYESVFNHRMFTGRSGCFYKYEGLGSIYWHMVSKLLLALGENITVFVRNGHSEQELAPLKKFYYRIKEGIGVHKKPANYGAFPTDPYSHTPSMMGAQQPGLTGQVKEDVLSRFHEVGLQVQDGSIRFLPVLLREADFNKEGNLVFSFCNVKFLVRKSSTKGMVVYGQTGTDKVYETSSMDLPPDISAEIFGRTEKYTEVHVMI